MNYQVCHPNRASIYTRIANIIFLESRGHFRDAMQLESVTTQIATVKQTILDELVCTVIGVEIVNTIVSCREETNLCIVTKSPIPQEKMLVL